MGNKLGRRRSTVDERYTRPQGLYQHRDIDHRKLRRLILDSKLAPCYAGAEDPAIDLDECPICFLHYPSLNRSKCCTKGICTECFLQMKSPHSVRPTQCPYCKMLNYAVEYRGIKSEEEKGIEQVEEQKVIEAKIRMQQKELEEEHRQSSHGQLQTEYVRDSSTALEGVRSTQGDGISTTVGYQTAGIMPAGTGSGQGSTVPSSAYLRHNRDEFNIDLEDIMVMEAIWLSIQEQEESQRHFEPNLQGPLSIDISSHCASAQGRNTNYSMEGQANVVNPGDASERSSLTGGLAGVIAKLAERHVTGGSSPETQSFDPADGFGSFGTHTDFQLERPPTNDDVELGEELNEVFEDSRNPMTSLERNTDTLDDDNDQLLKAALEGSSRTERTHPCDMHASCCESDDIGKVDRDSSRYQEACPSSMSNQSSQKFSDEVLGARSEAVRPIETRICGDTTFFKLSSQGLTTAYEQAYDNPVEGGGMSLVPKNFEEQMRLAMALSLAEAQTESGFRLGEEGSCQILNNTS